MEKLQYGAIKMLSAVAKVIAKKKKEKKAKNLALLFGF